MMLCGGVSLSGLTGVSSMSAPGPSPFIGIEKKKLLFSGASSSSCHERFDGFSGFGSRCEDVEYPESVDPWDEKRGSVKASAGRGKRFEARVPVESKPP